ncbi:head decoration protein [Caulobacter sp. RL271]|uniref:Head decoration protein n=1 Tax=Caulobacter segnis TaxID=88688 RepID=A0ABY4ZX79_9CAUL|nr:head decoration protein [Caulobacter segnis]USQ97249.1 head decoration protein [Caulobacter segnis]
MAIKKMGPRALTFVLSEADSNLSRDEGDLAVSQTIVPGQILALLAAATGVTVTSAARAGNTGNGVLTLATPAYTAKLKPGAYSAVCTIAAANGGTFRLERDGVEVETKAVAANFTKELKFAIADGATDFVVGDAFDFNVDMGEDDDAGEQYVEWDPTATNGAETPVAFSCYGAVTDSSDTQRIVVIDKLAVINGQDIQWPDGVTDAQKNKAIRELKKRFIKIQ